MIKRIILTREVAEELLQKNYTIREIAEKAGVSYDSAYHIVKDCKNYVPKRLGPSSVPHSVEGERGRDQHEWAMMNWRKARASARSALQAMRLDEAG